MNKKWLAGAAVVLALDYSGGAGTRAAVGPLWEGPYLGQKPPGSVAEEFLPDIMKHPHSPPAFSPDGKKVYWKENGRRSLLFMEEIAGKWSPPRPAPFKSLFYRMDVPFFSPAGDKLYFLSNRPLWRGERIWYIEKRRGRWSTSWKAVGPPITDFKLHWLFSVAANGTLYFAGNRGADPDIWHIYRSRPSGGTYGAPERLGRIINAIDVPPPGLAYGQISPFIAPDESYLIFSSRRPQDAIGRGHNLYISFRSRDGSWTEPINLSRHLGLSGIELCPLLSPDGKYLFSCPARFIG